MPGGDRESLLHTVYLLSLPPYVRTLQAKLKELLEVKVICHHNRSTSLKEPMQ